MSISLFIAHSISLQPSLSPKCKDVQVSNRDVHTSFEAESKMEAFPKTVEDELKEGFEMDMKAEGCLLVDL